MTTLVEVLLLVGVVVTLGLWLRELWQLAPNKRALARRWAEIEQAWNEHEEEE